MTSPHLINIEDVNESVPGCGREQPIARSWFRIFEAKNFSIMSFNLAYFLAQLNVMDSENKNTKI